jgi:hypothetical protein
MKSALLVGISNYPGMTPMPGCTNDIIDVRTMLVSRGFTSITMLPDDPVRSQQATGASIVNALRTAISGMRDGDELVFYFSGHGVKYPLAGIDHEGLCGYDFTWTNRASVLLDDDLSDALSDVAPGARVSIVVDACHSGGLERDFALVRSAAAAPPFRIRTYPVVPDDIEKQIVHLEILHQSKTFADAVNARNGVQSVRDVVLLAACAPDEVAADADFVGGRANGVLTYALSRILNALPANVQPSEATRIELQGAIKALGFAQTPQLHGRVALFTTTPLISSAGDGRAAVLSCRTPPLP